MDFDDHEEIKDPFRTYFQQYSDNNKPGKLKGLQNNPGYGSQGAFAEGVNNADLYLNDIEDIEDLPSNEDSEN